MKKIASGAKRYAQILMPVITGLSSLWSSFLPSSAAAFIFPPVGSSQMISGFVCFFVAVTAVPAGMLWLRTPTRATVTGLLATAALISYFTFFQRSVLIIPVPQDSSSISISIGSVRSPIASACCGTMSDFDLLKSEGPYEEQVQRLWTHESIATTRLSLVLSFAAFIGFLTAALCGMLGIQSIK